MRNKHFVQCSDRSNSVAANPHRFGVQLGQLGDRPETGDQSASTDRPGDEKPLEQAAVSPQRQCQLSNPERALADADIDQPTSASAKRTRGTAKAHRTRNTARASRTSYSDDQTRWRYTGLARRDTGRPKSAQMKSIQPQDTKMKTNAALLISMLAFTPLIQAEVIDATPLFSLHAVAEVTSATGNWRSYNGASIDTIIDFSRVSDTASHGSTNTVVFNTFVWSEDDTHSTITLSFGADTVVNQPGDDLAIFSVGPATIGVTIDDTNVQYSSTSVELDGLTQGVYSRTNPPTYLDTLDVILIDLDAFPGTSQFNQLTIDALTEVENPLAWPGISAVGAFNTAVVPVPLPLVLFGSGLALLGWLGHRKK